MTILAVSLAVMLALTQPMPPRADFQLRYDPATQAETRAIRRKVVALDLLAKVPELQVLERLLVLPQPISVRAAECPGDASMYLPAAREIRICYAVLQTLWTRGERLADDAAVIDARAREAFAQRYVWANLRFILAHEVGHVALHACVVDHRAADHGQHDADHDIGDGDGPVEDAGQQDDRGQVDQR